MGNWFYINGSVHFDKYGDGRGVLNLLDRHLFSVITSNYKKEHELETSVGKVDTLSEIGLVKSFELLNSLTVKLSCSGDLGDFENQLIYCIGRIINYGNLMLERLMFEVSDMFTSGYYLFNKGTGILRFIDNNCNDIRIVCRIN